MNLRALQHKQTKDERVTAQKSMSIAGKKVCFTGRLRRLSRAGAIRHLNKNDAIFRENLTKTVDILVVGTMPGTTSKYSRAVEYNTTIMSEETFYEVIELQGNGFVE